MGNGRRRAARRSTGQGKSRDERSCYRRGYTEGWTHALEALDECLKALPPLPIVDEKYHECFDKMVALEYWSEHDLDKDVDPPKT